MSRAGVEALRRFFAENPCEELTPEDAAIKAGVSLKSAGEYLSQLVRTGEVERVRVYRAAPPKRDR